MKKDSNIKQFQWHKAKEAIHKAWKPETTYTDVSQKTGVNVATVLKTCSNNQKYKDYKPSLDNLVAILGYFSLSLSQFEN